MNLLLNGRLRRYILMMIDFLCIVFISMFIAFMINSVFNVFVVDSAHLKRLSLSTHMPMVLVYGFMAVVVMYFLHAYRTVWRYARARDFISCIVGTLCSAVVLMIFSYLYYKSKYYAAFYAIIGIVSALAVSAIRVFYSVVYHYSVVRSLGNSKNSIMIIGAGNAGRSLCELMQLKKDKYDPALFIDDDSNKIGRSICGVVVKGNTNEIPKLAKEYGIKEIVLAIPSISPDDKKRILNICSETMCKVSVLPDVDDYIHGADLEKQMKSVKIEDLLGRDPVKLDNKMTVNMIRDKVCLITGGGGSIGSELVRQIAKMGPKKLIVVDIYENNAYSIQQQLIFEYGDKLDLSVQIASVRDEVKMDSLFDQFRPDIVFHAAAHKHVPLMETNPEEAIKNNIFGTLNTARLAKKYKCGKFVLVSTDKAVNPTNIMGATKRCCEMIVECMAQEKSDTEFVAVRFGNVLGSNGSVIPLFEAQIAKGGPVTLTDERIIRYFMTIPEAASLILQAATLARGGEIFVLDMGEPVKILKLAENLIKLHGFRPYEDIEIKIIGLRPGEKLYEELLMDEEGLKNTANNKIFIGHQIEVDKDDFLSRLEELKKAAYENDKGECERLMHIIVPTFIRKNNNKNKAAAQ